MENLPVPKNVLDVEFKLFGALSVKQFFKVLAGCVGGVLFFLLPVNILIRIPLMAGSVILGVGAALLPGFEVRVTKLIKYIFVSPRYFWKKASTAPEVLKMDAPKPVSKEKTETTSEISIDELLERRSSQLNTPDTTASSASAIENENNLDRLLDDVYKDEIKNDIGSPISIRSSTGKEGMSGKDAVPLPGNDTPRTSKDTDNSVSSTSTASQGVQSTEDVETRMQSTDILSRLQANGEVDDMYSKVKEDVKSALLETEERQSRNIFGIVVDKNNSPLASARIEALDINGALITSTISATDGRFALELPGDTKGAVVLRPSLAGYKFAQFKIGLDVTKLPAFKLRAS